MPRETGMGDPATARLYGRSKGKRLRPGQQDLMDTMLPRLRVALPEGAALAPSTLFGPDAKEVWLEIGYGGGEHLIAQADANRDVGLIGCEFFVNGVAKVLRRVDDLGLENIRLHDGDARVLMAGLEPASVSRAFLLYPDPWPKTRHHKRRFVQHDTLDAFARILKPGAVLRFASDIPDYVRWVLWHMRTREDFEWLAERPADWREPWSDWPGTRYESKAFREGRVPSYLTFRRK